MLSRNGEGCIWMEEFLLVSWSCLQSSAPQKNALGGLGTERGVGGSRDPLPGVHSPACAPCGSPNLCRVPVGMAVFTPFRAPRRELLFPNQEVSNVTELPKEA